MDDFGTGYSSLAYLGRYPFDVLKIDESFIRALSTGADQLRLLRGVVNLAHDLGLEVVAEGVETEAERSVLADLGCNYAQGCLFARPLPAEEAENLLCPKLTAA